jgi:hypothetical protein
VFYVDDGVFWSDHDAEFARFLREAPAEFQKYNLTFAEDKCAVVKQHNVELVPKFKFLGAIISPSKGLLRTQTRKGKSLEYTFSGLAELTHALEQKLGATTHLGRMLEDHGLSSANAFIYLYIYFLSKYFQLPANIRATFHERGLFGLDAFSKKALRRFLVLMDGRPIPTSSRVLNELEEFELQLLKDLTDVKLVGAEVTNLVSKISQTGKLSGPFGGVILARMYGGSKVTPSMDTPTGSQDFTFRASTGSPGHLLRTHLGKAVTLSNGSSYATRLLLDIAASLNGRAIKHTFIAIKVPRSFYKAAVSPITGAVLAPVYDGSHTPMPNYEEFVENLVFGGSDYTLPEWQVRLHSYGADWANQH